MYTRDGFLSFSVWIPLLRYPRAYLTIMMTLNLLLEQMVVSRYTLYLLRLQPMIGPGRIVAKVRGGTQVLLIKNIISVHEESTSTTSSSTFAAAATAITHHDELRLTDCRKLFIKSVWLLLFPWHI